MSYYSQQKKDGLTFDLKKTGEEISLKIYDRETYVEFEAVLNIQETKALAKGILRMLEAD